MDIIDMIRYLNSADGPNIPLRTLATYCGSSAAALCKYINNKAKPNDDTRKQLELGIGQMVREIIGEWRKTVT